MAIDPTSKDKIREIDRKILDLLEQRARAVGAWRSETCSELPTLRNHQRESLASAGSHSQTPPKAWLQSVLSTVVGATYLAGEDSVRIACLGPEHSYSYQAAAKYFGQVGSLQSVNSIRAVFDEVTKDQATYGVVPIENSTDGRIVDTLNMFIHCPIQICGEILLPIHHSLLARCKRDSIQVIYSKPQALSQCRGWLSNHVPQARWVEVASTAAAAKIASEEPNAAAVASANAAIQLGLDVLAESIEDNPNNQTRFVIISKEKTKPTENDKSSIMFQVPHRPGALADVMVMFKSKGLNLTWIESFPVPGVANEYFFFVELEGHCDQPDVADAIETLRSMAIRLDFLGSYPRAAAITN